MDFYHLSENISDYAKVIYPEDEVGRKKWVKEVLDAVTSGKIDHAIKLVEKKKDIKVPEHVMIHGDTPSEFGEFLMRRECPQVSFLTGVCDTLWKNCTPEIRNIFSFMAIDMAMK